jgi:hypothetical protein
VISRVAALSAGFKRSYAYMLATGQKGGPTWRSISTFDTKNALPNYPARFNIAPTDPVLTVRFSPETKERTFDALRWGLVPHWANDLKLGSRMINARAEMVVTIPAFRDAFKSRRCIIPASGFYEWKQTGGAKHLTPSYLRASNCSPSPAYGRTGATKRAAKAWSGSGHARSSPASPMNWWRPSTTGCQ